MPDVFVPQDTIAYNEYYTSIVRKSLPNKFSLKYVDSHRKELSTLKSWKEVASYLDKEKVFDSFLKYAADNGIKRTGPFPAEASEQLERVLYSGIIYDAMDMEDYMAYINTFDVTVKKAIDILSGE